MAGLSLQINNYTGALQAEAPEWGIAFSVKQLAERLITPIGLLNMLCIYHKNIDVYNYGKKSFGKNKEHNGVKSILRKKFPSPEAVFRFLMMVAS